MIIVEVDVPMMGKCYDFQIDENVSLFHVKEEIAEMICRREQCETIGDLNRLLMWDFAGQRKLMQEKSASENGIMTGSRIVMI